MFKKLEEFENNDTSDLPGSIESCWEMQHNVYVKGRQPGQALVEQHAPWPAAVLSYPNESAARQQTRIHDVSQKSLDVQTLRSASSAMPCGAASMALHIRAASVSSSSTTKSPVSSSCRTHAPSKAKNTPDTECAHC